MKISREWATPLTIGAFALMVVTGVLMFFHLETGLNKLAHEWLGWVLVVGAAAHVSVNWICFKRYFINSQTGRAILAASLVLIACTFISPPGLHNGGPPPPVLAFQALTKAPLSNVAYLTGRPVEQMMDELSKAGIQVPNADTSLESVAAGDRKLMSKAVAIVLNRH